MLKIISKSLPIFLLFLTVYFMKNLNFVFYNSFDSPDFLDYFNYFEYFFNQQTSPGREQGLFYFYTHAWHFFINYNDFNSINFYTYIHKSIQEVNFYFYTFGLLGYYCLLNELKFTKKTAIYTLIFLNFFPVSIVSRLIFKPEIVAFAFLPWIILCLEKFLSTKKIKFIVFSSPFIILSALSKGSVLAILLTFLTINYLPKIFFSLKKSTFLLLIISFVGLFSLVAIEDISTNNRNLIDIQSGSNDRPEWNFKAPVDIIYKVEFYKLVSSPIKNQHADSFLAITTLDTFGDYFDLFWNNDASLYFQNRKEIISFQESNLIKAPEFDQNKKSITIYLQKNTDIYLRSVIGLFLTILFYYKIIKQIINKNKYRKFLMAPFIGISIILFHIISGFPINNFNPLLGDTLKPIYYSYFVCLAAVFLIANIIEERKGKILLLIPYILIIIFLLGFPKASFDSSNGAYNRQFITINNYSPFCEVNEYLFLDKNLISNDHHCDRNDSGFQRSDNLINLDGFNNKPRFKFGNTLLGVLSLLSSLAILVNIYSVDTRRIKKFFSFSLNNNK